MVDFNNFYDVDGGLTFLDNIALTAGPDDPRIVDPTGGTGGTIPIGSTFYRSGLATPETYIKTGAGALDWTLSYPIDPKQHMFAHNGGISQTFSIPTTINFATVVRSDGNYTEATVSGGTEVTLNADGWFEFTYGISTNNTTGARTISRHTFEIDTGAGFVAVSGSTSFAYARTQADGEGTATATVKINITNGDVIRVRSDVPDSQTVATVADGCRLNIESIDGP